MNNFWQNKKILVTSGTDFLGKYVVDKLLKRGINRKDIFIPVFPEFDLMKMKDCQKAIKRRQIVIHLAGVVGGIGFNRKHPGKSFYDNAAMALNLLEVARLERIEKFVGLGSICSYPKITPVPFDEVNLWSGYPEETNAPYGLAKKFMLVQSQAYRVEYGLNAIHLLMSNLYGPEDDFRSESSHVIAAIIRKIYEAQKIRKNYIEIWGTGKPTRDFLYVEDAAEGIILAVEKYNKPQPLNFGSGTEISIKNLTKLICKLMNFNGKIRWDPTKPDGQPRRWVDISMAKKEIGFQPKTSFTIGLKKTIRWYKMKNKYEQ